ncbi:ABC transporter ATP-binding protein [Kribbella sp. NPDC051620]|uniref:ABC transporter ATP-binding protein n=1 Tax=Kribbella sp. NPDC051620 TaxID=3364120 RepID=UPI0037995EF0
MTGREVNLNTHVDDADLLLQSSELAVDYRLGRDSRIRALDSATLEVRRSQIVAVVGESGSGKSTLGLAVGRLLPGNSELAGGSLRVGGVDMFTADGPTVRRTRRDVLGFIFQNPIAALDPTMRIRAQVTLAAPRASMSAQDALAQVGLRDVKRVLESFPHELSGGMAQRVGIAIALLRRPQLLIADEPTAAVDATLRGQILDLLIERCAAEQCALMLLTHDLHAVEKYATHVAVMYGGRVVEFGPADAVLVDPKHPYTQALVTALPGEERYGERLEAIGGTPPVMRGPVRGCAFAGRCPHVVDVCWSTRPTLEPLPTDAGRKACCHRVQSVATGVGDDDA